MTGGIRINTQRLKGEMLHQKKLSQLKRTWTNEPSSKNTKPNSSTTAASSTTDSSERSQ